MSNEEDSKVLTIPEFIAGQEELEKEAAEVLPGEIDQCTYHQGLIQKKKKKNKKTKKKKKKKKKRSW